MSTCGLSRMYNRDNDTFSSIDVDLPVDCDDEYWNVSDPDLPFRQPEGKPSRLSYFRHTIQLKTINLRAMRRVVRSRFSSWPDLY
jgi:hypothetical protein